MGAKAKTSIPTNPLSFTDDELTFLVEIDYGIDYNNYELSLNILNRIITNQLERLTSDEASKIAVLRDMQFKIYDWLAASVVDKMISDPSYFKPKFTVPGFNKTKAISLREVRSTKSQCHSLIISKLKKREMTRKELAESTGLRIQSVCGRVNELLSSGEIEVVGTKWDSDTERKVEVLGVL